MCPGLPLFRLLCALLRVLTPTPQLSSTGTPSSFRHIPRTHIHTEDESLTVFASPPGAIDLTSARPGDAPVAVSLQVPLQAVALTARFTKVAWSGGRYLAPNEAAEANIAVIGAKVGRRVCFLRRFVCTVCGASQFCYR